MKYSRISVWKWKAPVIYLSHDNISLQIKLKIWQDSQHFQLIHFTKSKNSWKKVTKYYRVDTRQKKINHLWPVLKTWGFLWLLRILFPTKDFPPPLLPHSVQLWDDNKGLTESQCWVRIKLLLPSRDFMELIRCGVHDFIKLITHLIIEIDFCISTEKVVF